MSHLTKYIYPRPVKLTPELPLQQKGRKGRIMKSTVLQNILGFMGKKPDPPLTVTFVPPAFKPWYDDRIYEEIQTAEEDEAVKRIHKMSATQVREFGLEHKYEFEMGKYRNKIHTSNVIAKSVSYCVHHFDKKGAYGESPLLLLWDAVTDYMIGSRIANALDKIEDMDNK